MLVQLQELLTTLCQTLLCIREGAGYRQKGKTKFPAAKNTL